ncbi:MAG: hypothetical protein ACI8P3_004575 [Saprospiraceae bacterium]|jgi:hypothetical protein
MVKVRILENISDFENLVSNTKIEKQKSFIL